MNPWYIGCLVLESLLGIVLIGLILLHSPKAEGMGGIGGTASVFTGKRGAEAGLDKLTWIATGFFILICVLLGFGFIRP